MDNPFLNSGASARAYVDVRPDYPRRALETYGITRDSKVCDIGAGTGKLTSSLLTFTDHVYAVEPAAPMRVAFQEALPHFPADQLVSAWADDLPFPASSFDFLSYGQCWHWLDEVRATTEAARVLRPGGQILVAANHLAVSDPWFHRLARIMRAGDVKSARRAPDLRIKGHHGHMERPFSEPQLQVLSWRHELTPEQIIELGTTRSSYIRGDEQTRRRLHDNLRWYLDERGSSVIALPYDLYIWSAKRNELQIKTKKW